MESSVPKNSSPETGIQGGKKQESPTVGGLSITHSTVALGQEPAGPVGLWALGKPVW